MAALYGNSIVREMLSDLYDTFCFPGGRIEKIQEEVYYSYYNRVFVQIGIPDLHVKGEYTIQDGKVQNLTSWLERLKVECDKSKKMLTLLPIYPPLQSCQDVRKEYALLNQYIFKLNHRTGTPNTVGKLFYMDSKMNWEVDCDRLKPDGIHPTHEEAVRMTGKLNRFIKQERKGHAKKRKIIELEDSGANEEEERETEVQDDYHENKGKEDKVKEKHEDNKGDTLQEKEETRTREENEQQQLADYRQSKKIRILPRINWH